MAVPLTDAKVGEAYLDAEFKAEGIAAAGVPDAWVLKAVSTTTAGTSYLKDAEGKASTTNGVDELKSVYGLELVDNKLSGTPKAAITGPLYIQVQVTRTTNINVNPYATSVATKWYSLAIDEADNDILTITESGAELDADNDLDLGTVTLGSTEKKDRNDYKSYRLQLYNG